MFGKIEYGDESAYSVGIPVPADIADKLMAFLVDFSAKNDLTKNEKHGLSDLTSAIQIKGEFHTTIGVFNPHGFTSSSKHKELFEHMQKEMENPENNFTEFSKFVQGAIKITGVGWDKESASGSDVIWVTVECDQILKIREWFAKVLGHAERFKYTDPHITLFTIGKGKDRHDIQKLAKIRFETPFEFEFNTMVLYDGQKCLRYFTKSGAQAWAEGAPSADGRPSRKIKDFVQEYQKSHAAPQPLSQILMAEISKNFGRQHGKNMVNIKAIIGKNKENFAATIEELEKAGFGDVANFVKEKVAGEIK